MSSKKILSTNVKNKEHNKKHIEILQDYLKHNQHMKTFMEHDKLFEQNVINKIMYINYKLKSNKILDQIKNKIKWVYNKLFKPYTDNVSEKIYNVDKTNIAVDSFFVLQNTITNIQELMSLIIYQYTFLHDVQNYLFVLSDKNNYFIHSELYLNENKKITTDNQIMDFISKYIESYNIIYKPKNVNKHHDINKQELEEEDKRILIFLENITQNIIKKTQKLNQTDFKLITYGSYTSYVLNPKIQYNDIDIYHSNPLKFLIILMMIIKFILDIDVDIFKIPYILGHLSLRFKNIHFLDCIYIDQYTMDKIPTCIIKNIAFVDPIVQMLNNFRMMSEIKRMHNICLNKKNTSLKYTTLLQYSKQHLDISFDFQKQVDVNIIIINDDFLMLDLQEMFKQKKEYNEIKHLLSFDYLVISLNKPEYFLKLINRNDILISKQYFALFNEIAVEFLNKDKKEPINKNNVRTMNLQNQIDNILNMDQLDIHESQIEYKELATNEQFPEILEKLFMNNNVLLMTNISTDIYIKNYLSTEKIITNVAITNISKETILSSFVLYNTIKSRSSKIVKFYVEFLLNFIKFNNKIPELELLSTNFETKNKEYNNIYIQKKIKLSGNHLTFKLKDPMFVKNLFFYQKQDQEYYNYKTFLEVTNYNIN